MKRILPEYPTSAFTNNKQLNFVRDDRNEVGLKICSYSKGEGSKFGVLFLVC